MHAAVVPGADDARAAPVEAHLVDRMGRHVDRADLRDRAHVPELHDAVGVAGRDHVAARVAGDAVARVRVSVEGLDA